MAVVVGGGAPRDDTALLARGDDARDGARARDAPSARARAKSATFRSVGGLMLFALGCYAMVLDGARERGDGATARSARAPSARSARTSLGDGEIGAVEVIDSFRARAIGNAIRRELAGTPQRVYDIGGENGTEFLEGIMEYVKGDDAGAMRVAQLGGGRDDAGAVGGLEKLLRSLRRARGALKASTEADTTAGGHRKMMTREKSKADRPVTERASTTQATRRRRAENRPNDLGARRRRFANEKSSRAFAARRGDARGMI